VKENIKLFLVIFVALLVVFALNYCNLEFIKWFVNR